jgi:putative ABC transport system permease protein
MDALVADSVSQRLFMVRLLALFAGLAVLLAAVGIYGVIAHSVSQRTHEIGIRMALGAKREGVLRLVLRQALLLAATGVALGIGGALMLTRFLSSLLFGVSSKDPLTFVAVSLLLAGVATSASFIPAWRAARVDPMVALRHE